VLAGYWLLAALGGGIDAQHWTAPAAWTAKLGCLALYAVLAWAAGLLRPPRTSIDTPADPWRANA
jgi:hypothetical protein